MSNNNQKTVYRTAQGKQIDLNKLINQNELTLAVGNKKVNARGDLIGPGGQVIKKNEDTTSSIIIPDQIRTRPQPAVQEPVIQEPVIEEVQPISAKTKSKNIKDMDPAGDE